MCRFHIVKHGDQHVTQAGILKCQLQNNKGCRLSPVRVTAWAGKETDQVGVGRGGQKHEREAAHDTEQAPGEEEGADQGVTPPPAPA
jgi:hypothetical protein